MFRTTGPGTYYNPRYGVCDWWYNIQGCGAGTYNGGTTYNNGAYNNGAYNNGAYNGGTYNTGAYYGGTTYGSSYYASGSCSNYLPNGQMCGPGEVFYFFLLLLLQFFVMNYCI